MDSRTEMHKFELEDFIKSRCMVVCGPSGCGKSYFINEIAKHTNLPCRTITSNPYLKTMTGDEGILTKTQADCESVIDKLTEFPNHIICLDDLEFIPKMGNTVMHLIQGAEFHNQIIVISAQYLLCIPPIIRKIIPTILLYKTESRSDIKRIWELRFASFRLFNTFEFMLTDSWKQRTWLVSNLDKTGYYGPDPIIVPKYDVQKSTSHNNNGYNAEDLKNLKYHLQKAASIIDSMLH